jgi:hypothetical protein
MAHTRAPHLLHRSYAAFIGSFTAFPQRTKTSQPSLSTLLMGAMLNPTIWISPRY